MTDTTKRPLVTHTGLITGAMAFAFPILADRFILSALSEVKDLGIGPVLGMAAYTAAAFVLLDSAMRPRRRVRLALWAGLALTALLWGQRRRYDIFVTSNIHPLTIGGDDESRINPC